MAGDKGNERGQARMAITVEQVARMRELWDDGKGWTLQRIAAEYGCHYTTVLRRVKPVTLSPVTQLRERRRPANMTSPLVEKRVIAAVKAGMSYREIRERIGPNERTIKRIMKRHGLTTDRKPGPRPSTRNPVRPEEARVRKLYEGKPAPSTIEAAPLAVMVDRQAMYRWSGRFGVCWEAQIDEGMLRKWHSRAILTTHLDTADRVLIAINRNWHEVYDPQAHEPGVFRARQRDDVLAWLDVVDRASRLWTGEVLLGPDDPVLEAERVAALKWAA